MGSRRNGRRRGLNRSVPFLIICLLLFISYLTYLYPVTRGISVKKRFNIATIFIVLSTITSVISISIVMGMIAFVPIRKLHVILRIVSVFLLFFAIMMMYSIDQLAAEDTDPYFGYGFFFFRGYIVTVFLVGTISLFFYVVFFKFSKRKRNLVLLIGFFVVLTLFLFIGYRIVFRVSIFNQGIFGVFDPSEVSFQIFDYIVFKKSFQRFVKKKRVNVMWIMIIPKFLIHMVLGTYWCLKHPTFVDVIYDHQPPTETMILIDCPSSQVDIELFPIINGFTFDEMKWDFSTETSFLQRSLYKAIITVSPQPYEDRPKTHSIFTYDGLKYETVTVFCYHTSDKKKLKKKNFVIEPMQKIPDSDLVDVSLEYPNIISIAFDSTGRNSFEADLSSSLLYIRDHLLQKKASLIEAFEFFNLHSIDLFTIPTTLASFTGFWGGYSYTKYIGPDPIPYWTYEQRKTRKKIKRRLTAFTSNKCDEWSSWLGNSTSYLSDHIHVESVCQDDYTPTTRTRAFQGPYTPTRKCLNQYEAAEIPFLYAKKLFDVYPTKSKVINFHMLDSHELSTQSLQYADPFLKDFLQFLESNGHLENSIIFLWSDHGNHESFLRVLSESSPLFTRYIFKQGDVEVFNPMLMILAPRAFLTDEMRGNLNENSNKLTVHHDLHKTIWNLMKFGDKRGPKSVDKERNFQRNKAGFDLFNDVVPRDRTSRKARIHDSMGLVGDCGKNLKKLKRKDKRLLRQ